MMARGVPAGRLSIEIVAEIARLQQDLDKAKRAVAAASGDIAKSARAANDNLAGMAGGIGKVGGSSRLASHHMANLSFQIQDVIVGLQGGQKPMTVFLQQGSQIAQIAAQAGVGLGGMAAAVGGMALNFAKAHPVLMAAGVAAGAVAAAFGFITAEINKNSDVTVTWQDTALGAFDAVKSLVGGALTSAFQALGINVTDIWKMIADGSRTAFNYVIGAASLAPRAIITAFQVLPGAIGEAFYGAVNTAIRAINALIRGATAGINAFIGAYNKSLSVLGINIPTLDAPQIKEIQHSYAGAGAKAGAAFTGVLKDTLNKDYIGTIAAFVRPFAEDRARKRLADEAEKAGKAASGGAKKGGAAIGKSMAEAAAEEFGAMLGKEIDRMARAFTKDAMDLKGVVEEIIRIREANRTFAKQDADAALESARMFGGNLRTGSGMLGGSAARLLGGILDMQVKLDENSSESLATLFGNELKNIFGENFKDTFTDVMAGAGIGALVGGTIFSGNQGAQIGAGIGGALGSAFGEKLLGGALSSISSSLGSAAGPLGAIAGSLLGGLVGGMFTKTKKGSATIGGSGDDFTVGLAGNSASRKQAANQAAGNIIDAIMGIADALGGDVDAARGSVSVGVRKKNFRVDTTGAGRTKKGAGVLDFGQDEEAAIKAAIADLIADGVITGLSNSVMNLLKSGDIERQLDKALKFQNAFDELEKRADPLAYELKALGKEFDELRKIAGEAGATAEELAKIEELNALKRKEIEDSFAKDVLAKVNEQRELEAEIMRLQGDAAGALALARKLELDAMDAALRPLQETIYALQDAALKRDMEIQLLEALGLATQAESARRAEYLKTIPATLHALQNQIWAAQDAAKATEEYNNAVSDARDMLSAAYNREASALQSTISRFQQFADTLRDFRTSLYGADSGLMTYNQALAQLMQIGGRASVGDETAMGSLPGVGRDFLDVAKGSARTAQDYARSVALVAGYTDKAIGAAGGRVSAAQRQLDALDKQVSSLLKIEQETITVAEAIKRLEALTASPPAPIEPTAVTLPDDYVTGTVNFQQAQLDALASSERATATRLDRMADQMERLTRAVEAGVGHEASIAANFKRVVDGDRIKTVETA